MDEVLIVVEKPNEVVRDDEGRVTLLTKKKWRNDAIKFSGYHILQCWILCLSDERVAPGGHRMTHRRKTFLQPHRSKIWYCDKQ